MTAPTPDIPTSRPADPAPPALGRRSKLTELFGADLRSLAAMRIGLALVILWDLAVRARFLEAHYTDAGVLPAAWAAHDFGSRGVLLSLHYHVSGSSTLVSALFLVAAVAAVGMLLGVRTRLMVVISWYLLLSLHRRNPHLSSGADAMLRAVMFWSMFLPLGARWSLDARRRQGEPAGPAAVLSAGTVALLAQICFVYWFTVAHRSHDGVWWQGETLTRLLKFNEVLSTPLGLRLGRESWILPHLTRGTMVWEIVGPLLAFSPIFTRPLRTLVALGFIGFHLGLELTMNLGIFPSVAMAAWLAFLPGWFWDGPARVVDRLLAALAAAAGAVLGWLPAAAPRVRPRLAVQLVAAACFAMVALINLTTVWPALDRAVPDAALLPAKALRLDQNWRLFAGDVPEQAWLVMPGTLASGEVVDLARDGAPLSWYEPEDVRALYPTHRWRKLLYDGGWHPGPRRWAPYAIWRCAGWNAEHDGDDRLVELEIWSVYEPWGRLFTEEPVARLLWAHRCGEAPREAIEEAPPELAPPERWDR